MAKTDKHKIKFKLGVRWGRGRPRPALPAKPAPGFTDPETEHSFPQSRFWGHFSRSLARGCSSGSDSSDFPGWEDTRVETSPGNASSPARVHLPRPPRLRRPEPGLVWDSRHGRPSALAPPQELYTPGQLSPAATT